MFPYPECTKQTRTNQNDSNINANKVNYGSNTNPNQNNKDFLRPVISNPSIPIFYNHESYINDKGNNLYNYDIERNTLSSRNDKNYRPVQSAMQSNYQFFNNNNQINNQINNIENDLRNPVNTRRDNIEKSRQKDTQQFMSVQGGVMNNFQDLRYVNTREHKNNDINTSSYTPMARTLAIPKENI
jgi:hypothetical protein